MIFLCMLIAVLAAVAFCLAIMLMQRDVLPGGDSAFVEKFAAWFNSHIFSAVLTVCTYFPKGNML